MSSETDNTLDDILEKIGECGKYQLSAFTSVCFGVILFSSINVAFVFIALNVDHRCKIPDCDIEDPVFNASWLQNTTPFNYGKPSKCKMFKRGLNDTCNTNLTSNELISCNEFIYKIEEKSILHQYGLQCEENLWKLTIVGSINNFGLFCGLLFGGIISDKFGRKILFIGGLTITGLCGISKSLMPIYELYLFLEFFEAFFGSGTFLVAFIIAVELVGPKYRVILGLIVTICYPIGEIYMACVAWILKSWRSIIYTLYSPLILIILFNWTVPESVRWCLSKGKVKKAQDILKRVAKVNGRTISYSDLEKLNSNSPENTLKASSIIKSKILVFRMIICFDAWITCAFLFYGFTLNSVILAGNMYFDFMLTAFVEIPACLMCFFFLKHLGRVKTLCGLYFLSGFASVGFIFIPKNLEWLGIILYLIGKFGSTAAFMVIYVLTSELFPTLFRTSLMGMCCMVARLGSMAATQAPLLMQIWEDLPMTLFAIMAFLAGFLVLLLPETVNIKLPDTIEEAVKIGKKD